MGKKRGFILFFISIVIILTLPELSQAGLGVTPSRIEFNFQPNLEQTFIFRVLEDNPERQIEIFVVGDLAEYVTFDKTDFKGSGVFSATLKLPEKIDVPGEHGVAIGVKEASDKELSAVGTAIIVYASIKVHVPYPGKYAEIKFKAENANAGEPVNFQLNIISHGSEDINATPRIEVFSEGRYLETLYFSPRVIKSQEEVNLKKSLNTTNYKAGLYSASAIVDYGKVAQAETSFNLGELFVDIVNYTQKIVIGKIQRFDVGIESKWNNGIENVYANVSFIKNSTIFLSFKTSPSNLGPWENATLTGFVDSSNFSEGIYPANITLVYSDKSSSKMVDVEFMEEKSNLLPLILISAIVIVVVVVVVISVYLIKRHKKNEKKKKK